MPLSEVISTQSNSKIYVWKIEESFKVLQQQVALTAGSLERLNSMKSVLQQRAFLSVRMILQQVGYTDQDLFYDALGKPHLQDGTFISITHSHHFAAVILSDVPVGIDMELQREKIIRIANKFCETEFQYLNIEDVDYIRKLTVIWGVKEAIFKIKSEKGISFKDHISVFLINLELAQTGAQLHFYDVKQDFKVYFKEIEGFTLVYAFEN